MTREQETQAVVITGSGVISPLGNDVETFWANLVAGKSGAGPITRFDATAYATRIRLRGQGFHRPKA